MKYQSDLQFFEQLLKNFHLPYQYASDIELRTLKIINPNTKIESHKVYFVCDKSGCHYLFFQIPESNPLALLLIGPYPLSSHRILLTLMGTLGEKLWGNIDNFSLEEVKQTPFPKKDFYESEEPMHTIRLLEEHYEMEQNFMRAVSQGQLLKAELYMPKFSTANSLRDLKNYTIILNTLLRKAAEMGAVHPFHIDTLSSYFAKKTEIVTSEKEITSLQQEMVQKYCLLVKNHSMRGYSPLIQKVVTQIDADITADLSLKSLAALLNINPSYLSTLFKRETGSTLTEYVNRKRIEHALLLLNSTNMQIQNIAQHCGVSDVNYFTKLFKKVVGKTPKEYRESAR